MTYELMIDEADQDPDNTIRAAIKDHDSVRVVLRPDENDPKSRETLLMLSREAKAQGKELTAVLEGTGEDLLAQAGIDQQGQEIADFIASARAEKE